MKDIAALRQRVDLTKKSAENGLTPQPDHFGPQTTRFSLMKYCFFTFVLVNLKAISAYPAN